MMMKKLLYALALVASFSAAFAAPTCQKTGTVCSAPNQTRNVSGMSVFRECWEYQDTYQCRSQNMTNDCQPLRDIGCEQIASSCVEYEDGTCVMYEQKYRCQDKPETYTEKTVCDIDIFCHNGNCFDRSYQADPDFARSMALMEAAREAGVYGSETSIFSGTDSRCKIKLFGLANCCKKSGGGGGMSNASMAIVTAAQAAKFFGSPYMYDAMFASDIPWLVDKAIDAWSANEWTSTTSFYGLKFSFSSTTGLRFVKFEPNSFMISVAIMIVQEILSCEQPEQILAMRRGQNLCVEVGTYCSKKILKVCVEKTKSFCCYNSRLARIINEQGRKQIGKSWGSAKNPNCSGFTQAEFAAIDFSRIDMSEFMAEIMANIEMPKVDSMSQQINTSVQQKLQNYYQR